MPTWHTSIFIYLAEEPKTQLWLFFCVTKCCYGRYKGNILIYIFFVWITPTESILTPSILFSTLIADWKFESNHFVGWKREREWEAKRKKNKIIKIRKGKWRRGEMRAERSETAWCYRVEWVWERVGNNAKKRNSRKGINDGWKWETVKESYILMATTDS